MNDQTRNTLTQDSTDLNALRVKVAELCEWTRCNPLRPHTEQGQVFCDEQEVTLNYCEVPDYPNDLNAIHEAEETLSDKQRIEYAKELQHLVGVKEGIFATAEQRCRAFILCHSRNESQ